MVDHAHGIWFWMLPAAAALHIIHYHLHVHNNNNHLQRIKLFVCIVVSSGVRVAIINDDVVTVLLWQLASIVYFIDDYYGN